MRSPPAAFELGVVERVRTLGDGTRVNVLEAGGGRPVVFVHGWPMSGRVWVHQLGGLSDRYRVIAPDLPGFGGSPPIPHPTLAHFADVLHRFFESEGLESIVLVGWSMGAGVVMSYCRDFADDRLAAIGIVDDCPRMLPGPSWEEGVHTTLNADFIATRRRRWPHDRAAVIEELTLREFRDPSLHRETIAWMLEESLRCDPDTAIESSSDVYTLDFRPSLGAIRVPAWLAYGDASTLTTAVTREYMRTAIPRAQLVVFEASGHNPMIEEPDNFNSSLDRFIATLSLEPSPLQPRATGTGHS